jgi:hypothetical protein
LAARCLIIFLKIILSFTFGSKNNNNFQVGTILNNEARVLCDFVSDFEHDNNKYIIFQKFWVKFFKN